MEFFDSHFHIWDVSSKGVHDADILFKPNGEEVYDVSKYESDLKDVDGFRVVGGAFLEAMSVCFPKEEDEKVYARKCVEEARWAQKLLSASLRKYVLVPTVALESVKTRENTLNKLSKLKQVRGIRQILNFKPSWPRNKCNLLENSNWCKGFEMLARYNLSFDVQLNPHQYEAAASLLLRQQQEKKCYPPVIIINHLGTPTHSDLQSDIYWNGLRKLAKCGDHIFMKISMLHYIDPKWDESEEVILAVHKVIELFGEDQCFFASNYPVELKDGWPAKRLFPAFRNKIASKYSVATQEKLFSKNAMRAYRCASY